jgi:hypothetical protein
MIFKFFKRQSEPAPAVKPKPRRKAKPQATVPMLPPEPSTLEVREGSEHADWALWEDSVAMMDSQLSSIQPKLKLYHSEAEAPTDFQEIEAFARVKHKDP